MGTHLEDIAEIDRLVHEPSRLAITSALRSCESTDFLFLQRATGLSKGNLSSHLSKPERGGLVVITKTARGRPRTLLALTPVGRDTVAEHGERPTRLRDAARDRTAPEE
ncbi:transcriptional regulator [Nocardiopsis sp. MG754419]|uniref:transcriptional regulator n=1 Tax=Nocardiopsis sp. MG754419 TaxID=2259865 RepID=UPI001BA826EE|nr:transcriptional regulator [Nocardiopsis sp. MG754419]MBR8740725.1 transcriptional regulator [Nocardiopsis sp. MG754419]